MIDGVAKSEGKNVAESGLTKEVGGKSKKEANDESEQDGKETNGEEIEKIDKAGLEDGGAGGLVEGDSFEVLVNEANIGGNRDNNGNSSNNIRENAEDSPSLLVITGGLDGVANHEIGFVAETGVAKLGVIVENTAGIGGVVEVVISVGCGRESE